MEMFSLASVVEAAGLRCCRALLGTRGDLGLEEGSLLPAPERCQSVWGLVRGQGYNSDLMPTRPPYHPQMMPGLSCLPLTDCSLLEERHAASPLHALCQ